MNAGPVVWVNLIGLAGIAFIVWWFWLARPSPKTSASVDGIDVVVDGGVYAPADIEVPAGRSVVLRFIRKDPSPCAEKVIFADLGVSADLVLDTPVEVVVVPPKSGQYEFTCQMGMYRGRLIAS